ncbi:hypothetical protein LR48_Vigan01g159500 [Vigna angularis]|uniref:Uncharacterized protein n=1 Tax=Phaseolus angularis TaxID=3914 RepID=A0A0L9TPG1_PHAAN|nr:hypothetical protein LR48_Vigan01g159500 [Vigna angularis]
MGHSELKVKMRCLWPKVKTNHLRPKIGTSSHEPKVKTSHLDSKDEMDRPKPKVKEDDLRWTGKLCSLPSSKAFGLGIAALGEFWICSYFIDGSHEHEQKAGIQSRVVEW